MYLSKKIIRRLKLLTLLCFSFLLLPDFTPVLLLLALSCPAWVVSRSLPPVPNGQMTDSCVFYARTLLENITNLLAPDDPVGDLVKVEFYVVAAVFGVLNLSAPNRQGCSVE